MKIIFEENGKVVAEDELTSEEVKALNTELELADVKNPVSGKITKGIAGWVLNILHNKTRQKVDEIVELSGKGSRHTEITKKYQIIKDLDKENSHLLKGAKQKRDEFEADLKLSDKKRAKKTEELIISNAMDNNSLDNR